jgi:hypothetical protein
MGYGLHKLVTIGMMGRGFICHGLMIRVEKDYKGYIGYVLGIVWVKG